MSSIPYRKEWDGIRALAVLMVISHHCVIVSENHPFQILGHYGGMGVELFFLLSGHLITSILLRAKNIKDYLKVFYWRRFLRIFPLYYLILVIAFVLFPILVSFFPTVFQSFDKSQGIRSWPYFLFLSNFEIARLNDFKFGLLDISWSLCIEEHFYFIWPLVLSFFNKKTVFKGLLALIVLSPFARWLALSQGMSQISVYVLTPFRLDALAAGALFSLGLEDLMRKNTKLKSCHYFLFFIICAFLTIFMHGYASSFYFAFHYSLVTLAFFFLFASLLFSKGKLKLIFSNRLLVSIGKYSYGLYFFHIPVQKMLRTFFLPQFMMWGETLGQIFFYLLVLLISSLIAAFSYHFFESFFLRFKEKIK